MRRVIATLIVAGLALGVYLLWPRSDSEEPTEEAIATTTTATTTTVETATTSVPATTTSAPGSHVVETVAEAEEILRELWFGWFEGIYNQDEDRIREVVATQQMLDAGLNASLEFTTAPSRQLLQFNEIEILRSDGGCLAVWTVTTAQFLDTSASRSAVDILRWFENGWRFATVWKYKEDLWEADCEFVLQPLS